MREVERRQHRPYPERPQHRAVALTGIDAVQLPHEPVVLLHLVSVGVDQVGAFLHLADRLRAVLACFQDQQRREPELALPDQLRGLPHHPHPVHVRQAGPGGIGPLSRRHGIVDVLSGAGLEPRQQQVAVGRRAHFKGVAAFTLLPLDEHRVGSPKLPAHLRESFVERLMHLLDLLGRGRVRDLRCGRCHWSLLCWVMGEEGV